MRQHTTLTLPWQRKRSEPSTDLGSWSQLSEEEIAGYAREADGKSGGGKGPATSGDGGQPGEPAGPPEEER
jgi:hypothetical protein